MLHLVLYLGHDIGNIVFTIQYSRLNASSEQSRNSKTPSDRRAWLARRWSNGTKHDLILFIHYGAEFEHMHTFSQECV